MTPLEFIALGLKKGQKVNLTILGPGDVPETVTCFFNGYRFMECQRRGYGNDDIIPVFCKMSKKGKKLSAHLDVSTWLNQIIKVEPVGQKHDCADENVSLGVNTTVKKLEADARRDVEDVLREMARLFPGRKVAIDTDSEYGYGNAFVFHKHGLGERADIIAVRWDPEKECILFDISLEIDVEKDLTISGFILDMWTKFRTALLQSIRMPVEDAEENFIDRDTPWRDIPENDLKDFPALYKSGALDALRTTRWFDGLSDEDKEKAFDRLRHFFNRAIANGWNGTFVEYINDHWTRSDICWRKMCFYDATFKVD